MKELILLRGLPGAGKSTVAKLLYSAGKGYIEADMYFIDRNGNYNFDASKLKQAHEWCQKETEKYMGPHGSETIVVANTFTQEWEMESYYKLAEKYGYRVHSLIVENRHGSKSVHDVPEATMGNMLNRFSIKL
jgi:predicted kinase